MNRKSMGIALTSAGVLSFATTTTTFASVSLIGMSYSRGTDSGNIWRIDPATGAFTSFPTGYLGGGLVSGNFTVQGNFAYGTSENCLSRWDLTTGNRTDTAFTQNLNALLAIPTPAALTILAAGGLLARRRRG
jgi:hypothetical protein